MNTGRGEEAGMPCCRRAPLGHSVERARTTSSTSPTAPATPSPTTDYGPPHAFLDGARGNGGGGTPSGRLPRAPSLCSLALALLRRPPSSLCEGRAPVPRGAHRALPQKGPVRAARRLRRPRRPRRRPRVPRRRGPRARWERRQGCDQIIQSGVHPFLGCTFSRETWIFFALQEPLLAQAADNRASALQWCTGR